MSLNNWLHSNCKTPNYWEQS